MSWSCPVCEGTRSTMRWPVTSSGTENGVAAEAFRPSADRFGETVGSVVTCVACGHMSLSTRPSPEAIAAAYEDAVDEVSLDEENGQRATADRALALIEAHQPVGHLLDVGCWTGSFLVAARDRGWQVSGVEPSQWAVGRAHERGLDDVHLGELSDAKGEHDAVALCDVLEHLLDPAEAVASLRDLVRPGGVLFLTLPDSGSLIARAMGRRWWSILPMHVQYFTRSSVRRLLEEHGFEVLVVDSHPKVFTVEYYLSRLGGYSAPLARLLTRLAKLVRLHGRLVAPDFHDRMQVLARRPL